ncbi:trypsin-like peptidase domain-containing protein [Candidatus Sumerlaeota bacterium]|nr:trypsin-like peptidase domain-containing protein [Candidatus Sumerlaeota bacterium]
MRASIIQFLAFMMLALCWSACHRATQPTSLEAKAAREFERIRNQPKWDNYRQRKWLMYEAFIREYPETPSAFEARMVNAELYFDWMPPQSYLDTFAFGDFFPVPQDAALREAYYQRVHPLLYKKLVQAGSIERFIQFIQKYPQSPQYKQCVSDLERLLLAPPLSYRSLDRIEWACKECPVLDAERLRSPVHDTLYAGLNSLSDHEVFLSYFPETPHRAEIESKIDDLSYELACDGIEQTEHGEYGILERFEIYLEKFPEGRHAQEARQKLEAYRAIQPVIEGERAKEERHANLLKRWQELLNRLTTADTDAGEDQATHEKAYDALRDCSILIYMGNFAGSGFILKKNKALVTNTHVANQIYPRNRKQMRPDIRFIAKFGYIGVKDPITNFRSWNADLAVFETKTRFLNDPEEPIPSDFGIDAFVNFDALSVGEELYTLGNRLGMGWNFSSGRVVSLLDKNTHDGFQTIYGICKALGKFDETSKGVLMYDRLILAEGSIAYFGNSGGPVVDRHGRLAGVCVAIAQGFAVIIPMEEIFSVINQSVPATTRVAE